MRILGVTIKDFRSIGVVTFEPKPGLNTLVGENSVGKSNIFLAMHKTLNMVASGVNFVGDDRRYGKQLDLMVQCKVELEQKECQELLHLLTADFLPTEQAEQAKERLQADLGRTLEIVTRWYYRGQEHHLKLGPLFIWDGRIGPQLRAGGGPEGWDSFLQALVKTSLTEVLSKQVMYDCANIGRNTGNLVRKRFLKFEEFRSRPVSGSRSQVMEALTGSETATVLYNLKNHPDPHERERYVEIQQDFATLVPSLTVEAVETDSASGAPTLQFLQKATNFPIPLANVSAGVAELLTGVTNLVAREGHVLVIENPEQHLHPHHQRRLHRLIVEAAKRNQVFVVTHSPFFVEPGSLDGLSRVWMTADGTKLSCFPSDLKPKEKAALREALRNTGQRELLFARAVLLVEDDTQREFLATLAPRLDHDLDASSVSVVSVGGEDGFKPYVKLLRALEIPFRCLRDKAGGSPPEDQQYFCSLDGEFEDFLCRQGLGGELAEARKATRGQKVSPARHLAATIPPEKVPDLFRKLLTELKGLSEASTPGVPAS